MVFKSPDLSPSIHCAITHTAPSRLVGSRIRIGHAGEGGRTEKATGPTSDVNAERGKAHIAPQKFFVVIIGEFTSLQPKKKLLRRESNACPNSLVAQDSPHIQPAKRAQRKAQKQQSPSNLGVRVRNVDLEKTGPRKFPGQRGKKQEFGKHHVVGEEMGEPLARDIENDDSGAEVINSLSDEKLSTAGRRTSSKQSANYQLFFVTVLSGSLLSQTRGIGDAHQVERLLKRSKGFS